MVAAHASGPASSCACALDIEWCAAACQMLTLRHAARGLQAAALFYFMFAEAPNLPLTPPLVLSPADVYRLQKYTRLIACRYQAAASAAASPAAAVPTLPQPAHSQRGVSS